MKQTGPLSFDEIFEIVEVGEEDTYDFVIPETHCFIANGILVHNSGDLEQNADQVWSIYRKDKEAELAEIECLKGRDTGTWKTCLRFDRNIQRFYDTTDQPEPDDNGRVHWQDKE
jgi:replicative DNA helicase